MISYEFSGMFDDMLRIHLWGYNIETVLAEKIETILVRGVFSTRPRDYYDVYILSTTQEYDKKIFREALQATALHRGSWFAIQDMKAILHQITESKEMKEMWKKYQKKFIYAADISYDMIIQSIYCLLDIEEP